MKFLKNNIFSILLLIFLILNYIIWFFYTNKIKQDFTITPLPPSQFEMNIFSLGDKALLYRIYGFKLQNAGDTFGETTPLKNYDYEKLEKWFYALDKLDDKSEYVPSIAGFYFSSSQNQYDNKYIIDYLIDFADKNPNKNWRWYVTSAYIAKYKLKNKELAFSIAKKLLTLENKEIPFINRAMVLFFLNKKDLNNCKIVKMIKDLIKNGDLESILKDKLFSTKKGQYNLLFQIIKSKIDHVVNNKKLLYKCLLN